MTVAITYLAPMQVHRLKRRIRDLESLRRRVDAELDTLRADLAVREAEDEEQERVQAEQEKARARSLYKRGSRKPCGTEEGYQWHRHWERDTNWPLPKDDPCGCRAAHRESERRRRLAAQARAAGEGA